METVDREQLLRLLTASRKKLLESAEGLTEEQAKMRPAEDRWTILECVEHVGLVEDVMFSAVTTKMAPSEPPSRRTYALAEGNISSIESSATSSNARLPSSGPGPFARMIAFCAGMSFTNLIQYRYSFAKFGAITRPRPPSTERDTSCLALIMIAADTKPYSCKNHCRYSGRWAPALG